MSSITPSKPPTPGGFIPPECLPNYDLFITEDGKPVDNVYSEKQMRLLTSVLYSSWQGPGNDRPFLTMANVGLFFAVHEPPVVPDVMLSLDVRAGNPHLKKYRSYFVWEYGKAPEVAIEVVSNDEGEELGKKRRIYARIGVPYYLVWDPEGFLGEQKLHCLLLRGRKYVDHETWFPDVGLGLTQWQGNFEDMEALWLRWTDEQGNLLPTATEKHAQEKSRADKLAAQLRALGFEPEQS